MEEIDRFILSNRDFIEDENKIQLKEERKGKSAPETVEYLVWNKALVDIITAQLEPQIQKIKESNPEFTIGEIIFIEKPDMLSLEDEFIYRVPDNPHIFIATKITFDEIGCATIEITTSNQILIGSLDRDIQKKKPKFKDLVACCSDCICQDTAITCIEMLMGYYCDGFFSDITAYNLFLPKVLKGRLVSCAELCKNSKIGAISDKDCYNKSTDGWLYWNFVLDWTSAFENCEIASVNYEKFPLLHPYTADINLKFAVRMLLSTVFSADAKDRAKIVSKFSNYTLNNEYDYIAFCKNLIIEIVTKDTWGDSTGRIYFPFRQIVSLENVFKHAYIHELYLNNFILVKDLKLIDTRINTFVVDVDKLRTGGIIDFNDFLKNTIIDSSYYNRVLLVIESNVVGVANYTLPDDTNLIVRVYGFLCNKPLNYGERREIMPFSQYMKKFNIQSFEELRKAVITGALFSQDKTIIGCVTDEKSNQTLFYKKNKDTVYGVLFDDSTKTVI